MPIISTKHFHSMKKVNGASVCVTLCGIPLSFPADKGKSVREGFSTKEDPVTCVECWGVLGWAPEEIGMDDPDEPRNSNAKN